MMLRSYQRQTCTLEARSGIDKFGDETFGAATTIACRWERRQVRVRAEDGDGIELGAGVLTLPADVAPAVGDRVTVDGAVYRVATVEDVRTAFGTLSGRKAVLR